MTLQQQVCSLELAKRLKELGVKQESYFWWRSPLAHYGYPDWSLSDGELGHGSESFSAFTVAELGEMLPYYASSERHSKEWRVGKVKQGVTELWASGETEADARAKALIYLLENELIIL